MMKAPCWIYIIFRYEKISKAEKMLEKRHCSAILLDIKQKISIDETNDVLFIVSMWTKTDINGCVVM